MKASPPAATWLWTTPGGLACRTTFPTQAAGRSGQEPVNQERVKQSSGWQVGAIWG